MAHRLSPTSVVEKVVSTVPVEVRSFFATVSPGSVEPSPSSQAISLNPLVHARPPLTLLAVSAPAIAMASSLFWPVDTVVPVETLATSAPVSLLDLTSSTLEVTRPEYSPTQMEISSELVQVRPTDVSVPSETL